MATVIVRVKSRTAVPAPPRRRAADRLAVRARAVVKPLFSAEHQGDPSAAALRIALPARGGHFDEMRSDADTLRDAWRAFFGFMGTQAYAEMDHRVEVVRRQIRENGITYNVYADANGPARPWSLDLLPFVIEEHDWTAIEAGIVQRARLLNMILQDTYQGQALIEEGLLPSGLVHGHPGYLNPLQGFEPPGGTYLHIAAFDLARSPEGGWSVVSQRTQAPSGLGYILENRLTISRMFPPAFRELQIQHLAASYRFLLDTLYRLAPKDDGPQRIVLLTPGPFNETYFEHAYLARYLGIPLVEGSDLTVRDEMLFLKSLHGLERVHAVLRRVDDDYCDPLELRSDSSLGVAGLLQVIRANKVLVANALGSSFLESPALNAYLPQIAQRLLGHELSLPTLSSWWCGEESARAAMLPYLGHLVIKPTYPFPAVNPVMGSQLTERELEQWRERIAADGDRYTLQAYVPLSQAPTWSNGRIVPRAAMVRVFALADGAGGWHVIPGGLTRIASHDQQVVSMQRGGSSLDTWVMTSDAVDTFTMIPEQLGPEDLAHKRRPVSSRAAENLFWMGRYAERSENDVRLARVALAWLNGDEDAPEVFLQTLAQLCRGRNLIKSDAPAPTQSLRGFERALIAGLVDLRYGSGVAFNLGALTFAAGQIRDRLSPTHWRLVLSVAEDFSARMVRAADNREYSSVDALPALEYLAMQLSAVTGAQNDRMTRDDGWRLLTIGRQVERLVTCSNVLSVMFESGAVFHEAGFEMLLELFDSTITYRAHYQRRQEIAALLNLVVFDAENPRSLCCIVEVLRLQISALPGEEMPLADLLSLLPAHGVGRDLKDVATADEAGEYKAVVRLAADMMLVARLLSDEIGRRYFSHAEADQSLAA